MNYHVREEPCHKAKEDLISLPFRDCLSEERLSFQPADQAVDLHGRQTNKE